MPSTLEIHSISLDKHSGTKKTLPELVNAIALVIHKPARPAPFVKVATEKSVVTRTDKAPSASKFRRSQRFVIQNEYHIFNIVSHRWTCEKRKKFTLVVVSTFKCKLSKNLFSAENARTVTIPSKSSPKSEKMGDLVLDSIRRRSRPVLR